MVIWLDTRKASWSTVFRGAAAIRLAERIGSRLSTIGADVVYLYDAFKTGFFFLGLLFRWACFGIGRFRMVCMCFLIRCSYLIPPSC